MYQKNRIHVIKQVSAKKALRMIKSSIRYSLILCASVLILFSCKNNEPDQSSSEVSKPVKPEISQSDLLQNLQFLEQNMIISWDTMESNNALKMSDIKRFIYELEYIPGSNEDAVKELKTQYANVEAIEYNRFNFDSLQIEVFDSLQTKLIKATYSVASITPNVQSYPLLGDLAYEIDSLDLRLVRDRSIYDDYSIPFNCILTNYKTEVDQLGTEYQNLSKAAFFTLEPSCELEEEAEEMDSVQVDTNEEVIL